MAQNGEGTAKKKSPESEAQIMALILTIMVWLVVAAFIILFPEKILKKQEPPVYQDISLRLSAVDGSTFASVASAISSEAATSSEAALSSEEAPLEDLVSESAVSVQPEEIVTPVQPEVKAPLPVSAPPAETPKPVKTIPPQKAPASKPVESAPWHSATKPVESAPVQKPVVSPAEPVASQSPSAPPVEPVDVEAMDDAAWEALFAEKGSRSYNTSSSSAVFSTSSPESSSLSGVAGSVEKEAIPALSQESEKNQSSASGLSQETAAALERITSLAEGGAGTATTGETTVTSQSAGMGANASLSSTIGTDMNLVGGGSRRLLEPKEPVIVISEKNQSLIIGSIEVTITFGITPEGLVLPSSIKITPESLVHGEVQAEIKSQIEKWRFQVAQSSGQVRFKYNIIKK